jgi:hypothetical protein
MGLKLHAEGNLLARKTSLAQQVNCAIGRFIERDSPQTNEH